MHKVVLVKFHNLLLYEVFDTSDIFTFSFCVSVFLRVINRCGLATMLILFALASRVWQISLVDFLLGVKQSQLHFLQLENVKDLIGPTVFRVVFMYYSSLLPGWASLNGTLVVLPSCCFETLIRVEVSTPYFTASFWRQIIQVRSLNSAFTCEELLRVLWTIIAFKKNKAAAIRANEGADVLFRTCLYVHWVELIVLF